MKVAIFPDNFAKYRVPGFRKIGSLDKIELTIFSSNKGPSRGNVAVAEKGIDYTPDDSFTVISNRNYLFRTHILWTTEIVKSIIINRYDVMIVWGEIQNTSVWLALFWGRLTGRKVVIWSHGMYGTEGYLKRCVRAFQCRLARAVFLYGNRGKERLSAAGIPDDRLFVVYNSLDYDKQRSLREKRAADEIHEFRTSLSPRVTEQTKLLLFVGRLTASKRGDVALEGLAELLKRSIDCHLVIVGNGPLKETWRELAGEFRVSEQVTFVDPIYSEEKLSYYFMSADMAVCPGAVGLLAVHAHAYGLPVCTHDGSFSRQGPEHEIIEDGITGCIFKEGDARDFAAKIEAWFTRAPSRQEVAGECIARVEKSYNPQTQAGIIQEALAKIGCQ